MRKFLICLTACLTITGCATEGQYRTQLRTFVGQPKEVLVAKWGKPTGQYVDESGDEVIAYIKTRDIIVSGTPTYAVGTGGGMGVEGTNVMSSSSTGVSSGSVHLTCMTKFIVHNGSIQSFLFKGNDCKARDW